MKGGKTQVGRLRVDYKSHGMVANRGVPGMHSGHESPERKDDSFLRGHLKERIGRIEREG